MPAFDTPTINAPRSAHIHCKGSTVMFDSTVGVDLASLPAAFGKLSAHGNRSHAQPVPRHRGTRDTDAAAQRGYVQTDVAVVGGGITGLSTALHLAEQGVGVVLLEAEEPGWGASGRNGGQVNPGLKADPDEVEREFGRDLGGRMNALAGGAPEFVFDLIRRHGIRCDARQNGTLRAAIRAKHAARVNATAEQFARRGAPVELLEGASLERATGTARYRLAMLDRRGGDLNPLRFCARPGARRIGRGRGRKIARRHCVPLRHEKDRRGLTQIDTTAGIVSARRVVLAANGYTDDLWPNLRRTIVPAFRRDRRHRGSPRCDCARHNAEPGRCSMK